MVGPLIDRHAVEASIHGEAVASAGLTGARSGRAVGFGGMSRARSMRLVARVEVWIMATKIVPIWPMPGRVVPSDYRKNEQL
jgi:hypothetical protein